MATIEQIRALVADPRTDSEEPLFPDSHYEVLLSLDDNIYRIAADAARTIAFYYADKVTVKAGDVSVQNQQKAERYQALAKDYDQRAREGGGSSGGTGSTAYGEPAFTGVSLSEMAIVQSDPDRYPSAFYLGVYDNDTDFLNEES